MASLRDRFFRCALPVALAFAILLGGPSVVHATGATTSENAGTSLYSVTTALTAFASNVVGANTNDKHSDDGEAGLTVASTSIDKDHKLWELSNDTNGKTNIGSNNQIGLAQVGDAGCIIGYGDKSRGFTAYLAANETRSVTTSSYGAYLNVGDNGKSYAYARYGRLLTELGIDETGNPSNASASRAGGRLVQVAYVVSSFVPTAFDVSIQILRTLNPFRFLIDQSTYSGIVNGPVSGHGTIVDPFTHAGSTQTLPTGSVQADGISGVTAFDPGSALESIAKIVTEIYVWTRNIGLYIMVPLMIVFLIASVLLLKKGSAFGKTVNLLFKFCFIIFGIPMLGTMYTALLDDLQVTMTTDAPSGRIVAATFVDFENWVKTARLDPPENVALVSEGISDSESQGRASADSWRTVRQTVYAINYRTHLYSIPQDSGMGLGATASQTAFYNAGMWDTDGNFTTFGSNSAEISTIFNRMNSLLSTYSAGSFYTASAWESNVNSSLSANFRDYLGATSATDPASSNKLTIFQMYFDTDEVDDWMNRTVADNAEIFDDKVSAVSAGTPTEGPEEAKWAHYEWNIFCNGGDFNLNSPAFGTGMDATQTFTYGHDATTKFGTQIGVPLSAAGDTAYDAINPAHAGGLSTVSMYNYLASAFNPSNISVYSAANTTSEYTRLQHFSVNAAGSGLTRTLFTVNCGVILGISVILGLVYCFGMLVTIVKNGFSMIMKIPAAMLGVMASITQIIGSVISMMIQLIATVFLYQVVMELVLVFASIIETPVMDRIENISGAGAVGGLFAWMPGQQVLESMAADRGLFGLGLLAIVVAVVILGCGMVKCHRAVLVAWTYAWLKFQRLLTVPGFTPVFDEWVASKGSLYIWDEVLADMHDAADAAADLVSGAISEGSAQERGVSQC